MQKQTLRNHISLGIAGMFGVLLISSSPAHAQDAQRIFGTPMILDAGRMMLDGHTVELWGINMLAGDQLCWQGDQSWSCGEEALTAYKHFVEGQLVGCEIKEARNDGLTIAQCVTQGAEKQDIARHLIVKGWAFAQRDVSGNFYALDEDNARKNRLGIWTSRFQTADDWRNSVPNFVEYEIAAEPVNVPPPVIQQTIINNYNYGQVVRSWPDGRRIVLLPDGRYMRVWKRKDGSEAWTVITEQQPPAVETSPAAQPASPGLYQPNYVKPVYTEPKTITPAQPVLTQTATPASALPSSTGTPPSTTLDATATDAEADKKLMIK